MQEENTGSSARVCEGVAGLHFIFAAKKGWIGNFSSFIFYVKRPRRYIAAWPEPLSYRDECAYGRAGSLGFPVAVVSAPGVTAPVVPVVPRLRVVPDVPSARFTSAAVVVGTSGAPAGRAFTLPAPVACTGSTGFVVVEEETVVLAVGFF